MLKAQKIIDEQQDLSSSDYEYQSIDYTTSDYTSDDIKKGRFSKAIIISILLFLFVFVLAVLYLFMRTGNEPSTLISCVFAFCSIEGGALALIKTIKTKNGGK